MGGCRACQLRDPEMGLSLAMKARALFSGKTWTCQGFVFMLRHGHTFFSSPFQLFPQIATSAECLFRCAKAFACAVHAEGKRDENARVSAVQPRVRGATIH